MTTETIIKTMKTETLREAMKKCIMVPTNRRLPITSYAKLDVSGGKAILTTTDMEKTVQVSFKCVLPDMACLLPKTTVNKFIQGGDGELSITCKGTNVILERSGLGKVVLHSMKVEEFPPVPQPEKVMWSKLDAKWFLKILKIVSGACADELSRPVLTGVCCEDGSIAAADGFRLNSAKSEKFDFGLGSSLVNDNGQMVTKLNRIIIPQLTTLAACRLFAQDEVIEFGFDSQRCYFKDNDVLLTSQIIQGTYPVWEQLVPDKYQSKVSFSVPLMIQRLHLMDILVSGIVRLKFDKVGNSDECQMSAGNEDEFEYSMQLPVKMEQGESSKIAFNQRYIEEAIKPFSVCNLELNTPSSPGKFTGDIEGLTIVVMPMFVQW